MNSITQTGTKIFNYIKGLPILYKVGGGIVVVAVVVGAVHVLQGPTATDTAVPNIAHVSLSSVEALSNEGDMLPVTGTVSSVNKATVLSLSSGQIVSLVHSLGDYVAAGEVIASFENSSQRAAVLQAQGAYDSAIASQNALSPEDAQAAAVDAYQTAYNDLDTTLQTYVDEFFGSATPYGPQLLITAVMYDYGELSRERGALRDEMAAYHRNLDEAANENPEEFLASAKSVAQDLFNFLNKLAIAANDSTSGASDTQLSALDTARSSANTIISDLTSALKTYRSNSISSTASADASVTTALGGLRAAQANLEKTIIRAPISGTIVSLPIHKGDYVSLNSTVAAISNPSALEVIAYVTSDEAKSLAVGGKATIDSSVNGTIVFIAPAIDPATGKIEVKISLPDDQTTVTDGDTAHVSLERSAATSSQTATNNAITIPIAAAKITPNGPVVFTVSASTTLVANPITFGTILGSQVTVVDGLTPSMNIVTDARGLSDGQQVVVDPVN